VLLLLLLQCVESRWSIRDAFLGVPQTGSETIYNYLTHLHTQFYTHFRPLYLSPYSTTYTILHNLTTLCSSKFNVLHPSLHTPQLLQEPRVSQNPGPISHCRGSRRGGGYQVRVKLLCDLSCFSTSSRFPFVPASLVAVNANHTTHYYTLLWFVGRAWTWACRCRRVCRCTPSCTRW
jgi:hypothetical protein